MNIGQNLTKNNCQQSRELAVQACYEFSCSSCSITTSKADRIFLHVVLIIALNLQQVWIQECKRYLHFVRMTLLKPLSQRTADGLFCQHDEV